ncbi:tetratricopeptide repeat-containing sensor histidine kinase [Bizionia myxarmorum]|nr:histidine kinase dimerization/phosphoacceptor domain -containing protein [Bizionia myxarmorum]
MKFIFVLISIFIFQWSFSQDDSIIDYGQKLVDENRLNDAIIYYKNHLNNPESPEQNIKLLIGLADVYKLKLDYNSTNDYLIKAHEEIELTGNIELRFLYHVKMIEFYRKRGLYLEAIKHQEKAEDIRKNNTINDSYLSSYYGRRASIFSQHFGMQDSILKYANKSLELAKKVNHKSNIFYATLEIASVCALRKDYKTALTYFKELIKYSNENNLIQHQADVYINYTNTLIKDNQLDNTLTESLKALEFIKNNDLLYNEIVITTNVYETYKKLGNYEKAYDYLLQVVILLEKHNLKKHNEFLFELEEKYKLAEKENQIKINTLEITNQNKALASNKIQLYVSIGLFLVAIAITLIIANFLKKEKSTNKRLQSLSEENEFLLSEANHRINNNLQLVVILITDQLKMTSKQNSFELKNVLTKVEAISTLHKHLYKNKDKRKVDAHNYLSDVTDSFLNLFEENNIKTKFHIDAVEISSDLAMYLGLLLTELCINSIKHAFKDQEVKELIFEMTYRENILFFDYADNGSALIQQEIKPKLVDKLCRQLRVQCQIDTEKGFSFSFKKEIRND